MYVLQPPKKIGCRATRRPGESLGPPPCCWQCQILHVTGITRILVAFGQLEALTGWVLLLLPVCKDLHCTLRIAHCTLHTYCRTRVIRVSAEEVSQPARPVFFSSHSVHEVSQSCSQSASQSGTSHYVLPVSQLRHCIEPPPPMAPTWLI